MSFWRLEKANLAERAYLVPMVLGFNRPTTKWREVLSFNKFVLWLMDMSSAALALFLLVAGSFLVSLAANIAASQFNAANVGLAALYIFIGVYLMWMTVRVLQSCSRLTWVLLGRRVA